MKHEILTSNGIPVQLVRYCKFQDKDCLIFTKETIPDEQGYVTIHISEVKKDGGLIAVAAEDAFAKDIVKTIANEVKNNMPLSIMDLNYNDLDGINILSDKAFRVFPNYVECLEKNREVFESEPDNLAETNSSFSFDFNNSAVEETPSVDNSNPFNISTENAFSVEPTVNDDAEDKDYQKLYLEQADQIKNLNSEIEVYKNKIEMLKNIINN